MTKDPNNPSIGQDNTENGSEQESSEKYPNNRINDESDMALLCNPYLKQLEVDCLYHLALTKQGDNLEKQFNDVRFVCTGGAADRMFRYATMMKEELGITGDLEDITREGHRYSMFKVGPVLFVNHGMGVPSLSILLHELFKLLAYAKCKNVTILRLGTCGGLGKKPGTLIISKKTLDDRLRPVYEQVKLGKICLLDAIPDQELAERLHHFAKQHVPDLPVEMGVTLATNEFYEGQGRCDGAFCDFTFEERDAFLQHLQAKGVTNIEMESNCLAAFCRRAKIPCAMINVVLVDRLQGDQVKIDAQQYRQYQLRPIQLAIAFIKQNLATKSNC